MIEKLAQAFGEGFSKNVVGDVARRVEFAVDRQINRVKRKVMLFVVKILFLVLALIALVAGFVLLAAKYLGFEWVLIGTGAVLLIGFMLS